MLKLNINKVERERKRLKMTKTALAKRMGITKQVLNYIMNNRTLTHAHKIARIFDINPKDLIK